MKSGQVLVVIAGLIVVSGITYAFVSRGEWDNRQVSGPLPIQSAATTTVQVDDLADAPKKFKGEIVLRGVIARINAEKGIASVIDEREFKQCGEVGCARNYLPVKFSGPLPAPETVVEMTGRVTPTEGGFVFEAQRLEPKQ